MADHTRTTMLERVAMAIDGAHTCRSCGAYCAYAVPPRDCEGRCSPYEGTSEHKARAAIEAMREPTEAMAEAVFMETGDPCWLENAIKAWQAGIDAALVEDHPP